MRFLLKAKDITRLKRQIITDKNGHRRTVWVKINEDEKKGKISQQGLPPQIKEYLKQIEEGENLHELYHTEIPKLKDEYAALLIDAAIDKGEYLYNLFEDSLPQIKNQNTLSKLVNKAIDMIQEEFGSEQYLNTLYPILPLITDQKLLSEIIEKGIKIGQGLKTLYRKGFPGITDQKILENLLEKAIDKGALITFLINNVFPKIQNQKTLIRFAEKIYAKISDFQKFDNRDVLEELTYYVLPRIEDRKVLESFLDRIMNEDYFDLEKRLDIINLVFLGLQKNQKVLSELVINQIDELNKFEIKHTYSFEELRSFPIEIKNKIIKEHAEYIKDVFRRDDLLNTTFDDYLDLLESRWSLKEFTDKDTTGPRQKIYPDYIIKIIQSNIRNKALRFEQIIDTVVPTITEPKFFNKVVDKIDPLKIIKNFPKSFHEQALQKIVQKRNLQIEDNQEVINRIQDTIQKTFDKTNHKTLSKYEIISVVKYGNKNFNKELAIKKNNKLSEPIFHGSPIQYLDSFLENGIIVPEEERTGSMFGRGFYSTPVSSKAMQYLGDGFRETGTYGILFFGEQYLGKLENDKILNKDFDSVKGEKGLVNVEYATTFNEGVNLTHFAIVRT